MVDDGDCDIGCGVKKCRFCGVEGYILLEFGVWSCRIDAAGIGRVSLRG